MKKKALPGTALVGIILLVIFIYSRQLGICQSFSYSDCANFFDDFALVLFPAFPLFIFSLITYKMHDEVWQSWWKFSRIWIPLSMFAILISPSTGNWMIPIEKGSVALVSICVFIIISIVLIASGYVQCRKK